MQPEMAKKRIQFHVGLGKVASKYLQYKVFPSFSGIKYIPTRLFYKAETLIEASNAPNLLVSREFDQQFTEEVEKFAKRYPHAGTIILLRRPDSWIASQYRRFVKNGFTGSFSDFIDPVLDEGRFKMTDLDFYGKIQTLKKLYLREPLIIIYDEFLANPESSIRQIADYCGAEVDLSALDYSTVHSSYNERQLLFMQRMARKIPVNRSTWHRNKLIFFLQRLPVLAIRYSLLFIGKFVPPSTSQPALIPEEALEKIRSLCQENWENCCRAARTIE
jgi:hypothetical protein